MKTALITIYLIIALLFACWFDAMDNAYASPHASRYWLMTTFSALAWPIMLPVAMIVIAIDGGGRWQLGAKP